MVSYSLMIGFEQGTIVALNQKYPLVSQTICLFDLSKSIYGHLQELGLSMAASGLLKAFGASHSFPKVYMIILIFTWCFMWSSNSSTRFKFQGDLKPKLYPQSYDIFLVNFTEKEPFTKFEGVLISFHEVIKLQSFEFRVGNVIPENDQKTSHLTFLYIFFLILCRENLLQSVTIFFTIFHELM